MQILRNEQRFLLYIYIIFYAPICNNLPDIKNKTLLKDRYLPICFINHLSTNDS